MKTTTLPLKNSMNRSYWRRHFLVITFALACFALPEKARATCQDGCLSNNNTVQGDDALISLTTGIDNTAMGFNALFSTTTGHNNTATGAFALASNTSNTDNTATGAFALYSNDAGGFSNTATGSNALFSNTTGAQNTATGSGTLDSNATGNLNTADGAYALGANTTGNVNTATGGFALFLNTTGFSNTAIGAVAMNVNTTGSQNTAIGFNALSNNTTGGNNIALGVEAGTRLTTGGYNIDIGNAGGSGGESNTIRIGKPGTQRTAFIAGISGATVPTGVAVIVDASGHLGTSTSSACYKEAIKPMEKASEAILALKPVTFRYKRDLDPEGVPQFGLVAEQVEKVNPDLVARDQQGKPYTVRYDAVNAMLLNEFLKEHRTVNELKKEIAALSATVKQQSAQIQKVSAHLELSKAAPQTVLNDQ